MDSSDAELDAYVSSLIDESGSTDEDGGVAKDHSIQVSSTVESEEGEDDSEIDSEEDLGICDKGRVRGGVKEENVVIKENQGISGEREGSANKHSRTKEKSQEIDDEVEDEDIFQSNPRVDKTPRSNGEKVPAPTRGIRESGSPRIPPNALYRFLLNRGRIGHIAVTFVVLISEVVATYLPEMALTITWFLKAVHIYDSDTAIQMAEQRRAARRRAEERQFGGKKAVKARKKKSDELAVYKLRAVGEVEEGKYCHLSSKFIERHRLGQFLPKSMEGKGGLVKDVVVEAVESKSTLGVGGADAEDDGVLGESETEEEEDWVVQALQDEKATKASEDETPTDHNNGECSDATSRVQPSVSFKGSSDGASAVSVGFDFTIGGGKKNGRKDSVLVAAAASKGSQEYHNRKKPAGPKASDRNGGGGVMGRLRAAGANSIVSSRILGAYPADAVPITDAGSADGVIDLASRYGYGDWDESDDESGDSKFYFGEESTQRRRRKRRRQLGPSHSRSSGRTRSSRSTSGLDSPSRRKRALRSLNSLKGGKSSYSGFTDSGSHSSAHFRHLENRETPVTTSTKLSASMVSERRQFAALNSRARAPMRRTFEARLMSEKNDDA